MSHKATQWLGSVEPTLMTAGAFRVMFHLCDCHNPSQGCFPSQEYLRQATGLSNAGLNKILHTLEADGLIRRHRQIDGTTRRQRPTRYMLAFEKGFQGLSESGEPTPQSGDGNGAEPTPQSGDGKEGEPSPLSGDGADSTFDSEPTPLLAQSRLHRGGVEPVKEPVNNLRARRQSQKKAAPDLASWAERIREGQAWVVSQISPQMAREMLAKKLVTESQLRAIGISW